jgi:preprotein translocase subunit SecE
MDPELTRQLINIAILVAGVLAIIWVLRDFFKLAWRVIRIVVLVLVMLVILGNILGIIDLPRF